MYDYKAARRHYYKLHRIDDLSNVKCPVCGTFAPAMSMSLHHMMPRSIGEKFNYDIRFMILLHPKCHQFVHIELAKYRDDLSLF